MELSIIIVNFNVKYFLEQCLSSVERACTTVKAEVIVIDNHSTDNSRQYFENRFTTVQFYWNEANTGFARANNQALAMATGEHILFLNPDTILPEDCLEKCLAFMRQKPSAGALGVRMIDGSGQYLKESKRGLPTPLASLFKLSGMSGLFPRSKFFARYYLGHLDAAVIQKVDIVAGAFMMVKKRVLDITGGFDERFFMYGEDIDLSYRIQLAGFNNYYFPATTIIHFKGESTHRNSKSYIQHFYGAMRLFAEKHHPGLPAVFYATLIRLVIGVKGIWQAGSTKTAGKDQHPIPVGFTVIANDHGFEWVKKIVAKHNLPSHLHRMEPKDIRASLSPNIVTSKETMNNLEGREIIFCLNGFTAGSTIDYLQQRSGREACWFHFAGSESMVGSVDSGNVGNCIAM